MKLKTLLAVILAGCLLSSVALAKNTQLTGTVCTLNDAEVTLQVGDQTWKISRTSIKVDSGQLSVGSTVTVEFPSTDGHHNEGSCMATPTPSSG